jgi:hypothetical protein
MSEWKFYAFTGWTVVAFVSGAIVDQKLQPAPYSEEQPLAMVPKGARLDDNKWNIGKISGDVSAGRDLAVLLKDGTVVVMANNRIDQACGTINPIDPDVGNELAECPAFINIKSSSATLNGGGMTFSPNH